MVRFEKLRDRNWLEPLGKSLEYLHHLLMSVALVEEKWFSQLTRQHHLGNIAIWTFEWSLFIIENLTCFSKTSIWVSGGEKFLLKSRPHSPMATHSAHLKAFFAIYTKYISPIDSPRGFSDLAACFLIPGFCIVRMDS